MHAHQHEAGAHHDDIGGVGVAHETGGSAPVTHPDQDDGQGQQLADFHADVEGEQVGDQAVRRDLVLQDLGGQAEAVKQAKDQRGRFGVGLEAQPSLEGAEVVQRLVDHRETDDGVDQVAVDADVEVDPQDHRGRVPQGKQAHVQADVGEPVEEEDHTEEKQDVVVARHHVFGAQVHEGQDVDACDLLDVALVALRDRMGKHVAGGEQQHEADRHQPCSRQAALGPRRKRLPAQDETVHKENSETIEREQAAERGLGRWEGRLRTWVVCRAGQLQARGPRLGQRRSALEK